MKVIQLFEGGELKDQKLSKKGSQITIPEFKTTISSANPVPFS